MLVLTRKSEQSVILDRKIEVKILSIHGDQVSIGFSAPDEVSIYRKEVYEAMERQNLQSAHRGESSLQAIKDAISKRLPARGNATQEREVMADRREGTR